MNFGGSILRGGGKDGWALEMYGNDVVSHTKFHNISFCSVPAGHILFAYSDVIE